jgi:excisionase family DNA binding protein
MAGAMEPVDSMSRRDRISAFRVETLPTLEEVAHEPGRVMALPVTATTTLLAQCLAAQGALVARLLALGADGGTSPDSAPDDRLLDVAEAAARLGTSRDYLYRHARRLPFTVRVGSRLRFSSRGIDRFIRTRQGRWAEPLDFVRARAYP